MKVIIILSLICVSFASELNTYKDYLIFAAKNHYKSVDNYSESVGISDFNKQWIDFKTKFERNYGSEEEEERKFYFLKSLQYIETHKKLLEKGVVTHEVEINGFADWTPEEYQSMMSFKPMPLNMTQTKAHNTIRAPIPALPASFDWRSQNKVTPVKNQAQCGSCWAFATVATIESAYAIKHNQFVSLSEQQLVDCSHDNFGCGGGWVNRAMNYVMSYGLETETDYQYMARNQNCMNNGARYHMKINNFHQLTHPASDEEIMEAIMNNGPVAVNIDCEGNDFKLYRGGIITGGTRNLNHYVTAVGWGPNYWIIKNSWGNWWGEAGYARVSRGNDVRGFNQYLFYPIL